MSTNPKATAGRSEKKAVVTGKVKIKDLALRKDTIANLSDDELGKVAAGRAAPLEMRGKGSKRYFC